MDYNTYKTTLLSGNSTIAGVKRNQSDDIMNITFKSDPTYKKVRVLTDDGWTWQDAKYQKHTTPSILKDNVDYYLQFRPKTHFKIGTYVIVPDDTSPHINTPENPFDQPVSERTQWWLIVGRTDANAYVRYSILKANYNFKWIYKGTVQNVFGCIRNLNGYTSGAWKDEISTSLDNLTGAWIPDPYYVYNNYQSLGLCDTRTIAHGQRFFITNNSINPKVYQVTKVVELVPEGINKISIKQDELNETTDNLSLMICDYYDSNGKTLVDIVPEVPVPDESKTITISWMQLNEDDELDYAETQDNTLRISVLSYFKADFSYDYSGKVLWNLSMIDDGSEYDEYEREYYVGLLKVTDFEDGTLSIKPGKANSLIGKRFALSASDELGECVNSIELEVTANAT